MKKKTNYPYEYTSSELGKFFGISIKGIEYYEKKKLVKPERVGKNKQRRFNLKETYRIFMARYLRQAGFDISETLEILNSSNKEKSLNSYEELLQNLQFKRKHLEAVIEVMNHNLALLEMAKKKQPKFELIKSPIFKRLFLREMNGPHQSNEKQTEEYCQWNMLLPISNASLRYKKADILKKNSCIEPEMDMIITKNYFKEFGLKVSERVEEVPSTICLHTVLIGNAQDIERKIWFNSVRKELKKRKFLLNGDIITALLLVLDNEKTQIRYDEAWIPVIKLR
ncbi:MerR family transcriptional regulator [Lactobacillus panisapium]|uniref:MerR family transcriptional regulator n=1 Tax=Lactobacillus panisapium TaxID=2012495 RepID=UPI001C6A7A30|nr:MerR family transcriptional regulator [Lactobacillus panisapium]QYN56762.1 MerR family transcriptional regulator [Lactobacillus panisapium]